MKRALRFLVWSVWPPVNIRVARRFMREFGGTELGRDLVRVHWQTLTQDEADFLAAEGIRP